MKLIPRSSDISPGIDGICPGPFPPNGFTVLTDAAYGNGDCFGLYWPIGQEHKLPIVCETYHDEWRIVPAFSSIKKFEEWLEVNDDDPHENGISIEDQDFAANLFRVARKCLSTGRLDDALPLLQRATEQLPEVSEYWLALAIQYRRCKKTEAAAQAALNAYLGNWAFGVPDNKVIHLLSQAADVPNFQDDPVIQCIKEQGLDLSRATLGRWTGAVAELLEPLYDVLRQYVLMPGKVHADDIPVPVQEPGSGKTRTARLWVYVRDDRNAGSQMPPAVWFAYSPDRKGIHPQNHLAGYSGVLQADAYGGYRALYESGRITEAACMAHARRKIHDVHARAPTYITTEALQRIGELYAIEAEVRGCSAEQRLAARKARAAPLMQSLYDWIQQQMKTLSRHSDTAKAFAYLLKQWDALNVYCSNGWVEIDNNIAENALRGVAVGRKNWMFAGSDSGGEHAAVLYSLIGTCRLNNVEPEKWLRYVIEHIQDWPANRVRDLLPWKVDLSSQ